MAKKYNPLVKFGFDESGQEIAGNIITPFQIFIPNLIQMSMDLIVISSDNCADYNYSESDNSVRISDSGFYLIMGNYLVHLDLPSEKVVFIAAASPRLVISDQEELPGGFFHCFSSFSDPETSDVVVIYSGSLTSFISPTPTT